MTWRCLVCKKRAGDWTALFTGHKRSAVNKELCQSCSWDIIEMMAAKGEKYSKGDYVYKLETVAKYAQIFLYEVSKVSSYTTEEMKNLDKAINELDSS
jgi:hypothetical protein